MRLLKTYDAKDYDSCTDVFERFAARAIIMKDGCVAMQLGRDGDYKLLGGGIDPGEDRYTALAREVSEESGFVVIPESIQEIGEVLEVRRDCFESEKKFISHSYFYFCQVEEEAHHSHMTKSEIAKGYHPVWVKPEVAIEAAKKFPDRNWIIRDAYVLALVGNRL